MIQVVENNPQNKIEVPKKATKVDIISLRVSSNVDIPGLEPETQTQDAPINRTKMGKFPGRKLEGLRQVNGHMTLTQVEIKTEEGTHFEYQIARVNLNETPTHIETIVGNYEDAKNATRNHAVNGQVAFDVKKDYQRAN
jgi:hypothetical protein